MRSLPGLTVARIFLSGGVMAALACSAGDKQTGSSGRVGVTDTNDFLTPDPLQMSPNNEDPTFNDFGAGNTVPGTPGSGCPTTLSGIALDPAGRLPLYNVVLYVPSEPLAPLNPGAACETCDGNFSGRPIAAAVSDASGAFRLDISKVPSRTNIPLVIQAGKWRREVSIPAATDCADTPVEAELSRLPRSRAEGSLPKVAVMRGGSDALECLFMKIGVDPAEFTPGRGGGSVDLFYSDMGENDTAATAQMTGPAGAIGLPHVDTLFSDMDALLSYDMILMSCEGGDERYESPNLTHRENLHRYANEGGRLFGGHYHNSIIANNELPDDYPGFPNVIQFASGRQDITPKEFPANVNVGFEKGQALADWLVNVGGSTTPGQITINDSERTVTGMVHPSAVSWIDTTASGGAALYYGFPTPVDGPACGRMVFTDVHLSSGSGDSAKTIFPSCSSELSPQQLALTFLIFDLANCVQTSQDEPPPPVIIY
jgi:hypothetical protein